MTREAEREAGEGGGPWKKAEDGVGSGICPMDLPSLSGWGEKALSEWLLGGAREEGGGDEEGVASIPHRHASYRLLQGGIAESFRDNSSL